MNVHQAVGKGSLFVFLTLSFIKISRKPSRCLQILGNLPVTTQNVASLMHPNVTGSSRLEEVRKAVDEMLADVLVPLGEKDGCLVFLSEKLRDIEQERGAIALRSADVRRILNECLRESFDPLPRVSVNGTMTVASGLKVQSGSNVTSLAGEQNAIQTIVELASPGDYETAKTRMLDDSRGRTFRNIIGLSQKTTPSWMTSQPRFFVAKESLNFIGMTRTRKSKTIARPNMSGPRSSQSNCKARSGRHSRAAPLFSEGKSARFQLCTLTSLKQPKSFWAASQSKSLIGMRKPLCGLEPMQQKNF